MPDLDLIKQGEQDCPRGRRDQVNRAARLLVGGEGEALTRNARAGARLCWPSEVNKSSLRSRGMSHL
jgi:hypothetical protein